MDNVLSNKASRNELWIRSLSNILRESWAMLPLDLYLSHWLKQRGPHWRAHIHMDTHKTTHISIYVQNRRQHKWETMFAIFCVWRCLFLILYLFLLTFNIIFIFGYNLWEIRYLFFHLNICFADLLFTNDRSKKKIGRIHFKKSL